MSAPTEERPDTRDMLVVHQVFRREYGLLPGLVRGVADGDAERAAVVADHHRLVADLLHGHHTSEDVMVWPVLLDQAPESAALVERMQGQHARLEDLLERAGDAVESWGTAPDDERTDTAAAVLGELHATIDAHLSQEEAEVLPLCEQTMTPAQWHAVGDHGRSQVPPDRLFLVFGMLLEEAPPGVADLMLAGLPPQAQQAWAQVGRAQYADYVRRVRDGFGRTGFGRAGPDDAAAGAK